MPLIPLSSWYFSWLKDEGLPTGSKVWVGAFCCCLCLEHLAGDRCQRYSVGSDVIWHRLHCYEFPWLLPLRGYTSKNIKQNTDQRQLYLHVLNGTEGISSLVLSLRVIIQDCCPFQLPVNLK